MGRGKVRGRERSEEGERVRKGEGGLDLDICPGATDFLVTPLVLLTYSIVVLLLCGDAERY